MDTSEPRIPHDGTETTGRSREKGEAEGLSGDAPTRLEAKIDQLLDRFGDLATSLAEYARSNRELAAAIRESSAQPDATPAEPDQAIGGLTALRRRRKREDDLVYSERPRAGGHAAPRCVTSAETSDED